MNENHPSKVFKYCPFCGAKGFKWDGKNSFVCPVCGHQFFINMSAAVVAIIKNDKGEILLTRRHRNPAKGFLDFPGGFVDIGETTENAVVREVKEELNLDVTELKFYKTFPNQYVYGGIEYFTQDAVFFCKVKSFENIDAEDDVESYVFKHIEDVDVAEIGLHSIKNLVTELKNLKIA